MCHAKFQDHQNSGSEEDFKILTTYRHGSHLIHMRLTIYIYFCPPYQWRRHIKFDNDLPSSFIEDV